MLTQGNKAPIDIKIKNIKGEDVTLKDYLTSKYLIVYFYPKDDTPACTTEACELRDYNSELKNLGAEIVRISKDNIRSHNRFKDKHLLNFDLLSDPNHELQEAFGVLGEKKFMGRTFVGTLRTTFLLDSNGTVLKVWEDVKAKGHAKEIYNFITELS